WWYVRLCPKWCTATKIISLTAPRSTAIFPSFLHDALPISLASAKEREERRRFPEAITAYSAAFQNDPASFAAAVGAARCGSEARSEEHTSELQSRGHLVYRRSIG